MHGHFEDDERDIKGYDATRWLSLYELDAMLDEATVDAAILSWETDSAAVRRCALRHAVRNVPVAVE